MPTIGTRFKTVHIDEWSGDIKPDIYEAIISRIPKCGRIFVTGNWKTPTELEWVIDRKHRKKTSDYSACNTDAGFETLHDRHTKPLPFIVRIEAGSRESITITG